MKMMKPIHSNGLIYHYYQYENMDKKFEEKAIEKIASLDKRLEKLKQEKLALENEKQENQAKFATEKEKYANTFNKLSTIKAKAYSDHVRCLNSLRDRQRQTD